MTNTIEFVSFAIDPGEISGWAIAKNSNEPTMLGTTETIQQRVFACRQAVQLANNLPIVVVVEEWTLGGPRANYKMFAGLGKNYGRWLDHIELIIGVQESDILRVTPQKWRNGLFGSAIKRYCSKPDVTSKLKRLACAYVSPPEKPPISSHNAAEAGCIACWAHCSEEGLDAALQAYRRHSLEP